MKDDTPPGSRSAAPSLSDPERWVKLHGDYLFSYALTRLHDASKAEDAVQETFLAALKGGKSFAGRSAEKSWLVGILKNKICDYYRKGSRETSFTDMEFYSEEESDRFVADSLFKDSWIHELGPQEWSGPGASLDSEVFWQTFRNCANKLAKNVGAVFTLREVDGVESRETCAMLNISESNPWVMLHRARMALRRCLETNWFGTKDRPERKPSSHLSGAASACFGVSRPTAWKCPGLRPSRWRRHHRLACGQKSVCISSSASGATAISSN